MQGVSMNGDAANSPLVLPEILDLAAAEDFLELMRHRVNGEGPLRIDASAVETLTLPCVQIILAATRSYDSMSVKNPSIAFASAFEDLGIDWKQHLHSSQEQVSGPSQDLGQAQNAKEVQQQAVNEAETRNELSQIDLHQPNETVMSKRILTIVDSKTMRDMLMLTLAEAGFDVLQAIDGQDGLDMLVNEQVDVVITDINMPLLGGFGFIEQVRGSAKHRAIPILVLTTENSAEMKERARQAGATGWLVKPFDTGKLTDALRRIGA